MQHTSVRMNSPIEILNLTPVNPLISKCEIKVCYVDDKPNRNGTIITKETAKKLANSLPGSPIVGYFNQSKKDYEEHNRIIKISNGEIVMEEFTKPYGFVDLNAKVWFAKYLDDDEIEREYLVTEGWLWTEQYPECKRVIEEGNNQSMELDKDEKYLKGSWTKNEKGFPEFFIINEAIISKLCILGEDCEPCFEGSNIKAPSTHFSFGKDFNEQLLFMMQNLEEVISKGGQNQMFTKYAVNVGDNIWNSLYNYLGSHYLDTEKNHYSLYRIDGIYEDNEQKFMVLQNYNDAKYYRVNFSLNDSEEVEVVNSLIEVTSSYETSEEAQFNSEEVENYESSLMEVKEEEKNSDEQGKVVEENNENSDNSSEGTSNIPPEDEKCGKCGKPMNECACHSYKLEEIPEYVELQQKYSTLENQYNTLLQEKDELDKKMEPLVAFKLEAEKKEKQALIDSFYMLSEEDKKNVVENIDTYSLRDIEAELSIICVRNKVSFNLEDNTSNSNSSTTYILENEEDEAVPAWVKRAASVAKTLN